MTKKFLHQRNLDLTTIRRSMDRAKNLMQATYLLKQQSRVNDYAFCRFHHTNQFYYWAYLKFVIMLHSLPKSGQTKEKTDLYKALASLRLEMYILLILLYPRYNIVTKSIIRNHESHKISPKWTGVITHEAHSKLTKR